MKKHVTVVGAIQIGFAILGLIVAVVLFFVMRFARSQVGGDETGEMVLGFLSVSLPILFGFLSTLGSGRRNWSPGIQIVGQVSCNGCCCPGLSQYTNRNTERCIFPVGSASG